MSHRRGARGGVLSLDQLEFRYDPFPIGIAAPVFEPACYAELVSQFPDIALFTTADMGVKYVLSDHKSRRNYLHFIRRTPIWRELAEWITSDRFVAYVLEVLTERDLDLGYVQRPPMRRLVRQLGFGLSGRRDRHTSLVSRFEFSMLPADGGYLLPHTDSARKVISMVVSMVADEEWEPAFGGATDVNKPKHERLMYNESNRKACFDEMDIVDSFPFRPNQSVVFIRAYNSWHSVRPMTARGSPAMRKSITISLIER
jgi:hypothetical protein